MNSLARLMPLALLLAPLAAPRPVEAADAASLAVLSAGAIEPGVRPALAAFEKASGLHVTLAFATAPEIRQRMAAGAYADAVFAPPAVLDQLARAGQLAPARAAIGRVGLGVAVRPGAPQPGIGTADELKHSLLQADSVVFNRASTGLYVEGLLKTLGVTAELEGRTTRYPDGASVMRHLLVGSGREFGFGAMTEIALFRAEGLVLVGPLPPELQNMTSYAAAPVTRGNAEAAGALMRFLASDAARAVFTAAGIEPP